MASGAVWTLCRCDPGPWSSKSHVACYLHQRRSSGCRMLVPVQFKVRLRHLPNACHRDPCYITLCLVLRVMRATPFPGTSHLVCSWFTASRAARAALIELSSFRLVVRCCDARGEKDIDSSTGERISNPRFHETSPPRSSSICERRGRLARSRRSSPARNSRR